MNHRAFSEIFTEFAVNLEYKDIPTVTLANAKNHILDVIGVSLAGSRSDTADMIRNTVSKLGGGPECTVIGFKKKFPPPLAALANATMAHTPDFDDTHGGSIIHPSSVVFPTALAVAESRGADGKAFITAAVAGYEVILRLGLIASGKFHERGFHPTSVCGVFGASLIAGKLKGLNSETICNAMGIAGSQASGILEFLSDGSSTKRIHPGWASCSGIIASMLAEEGLTGPKTVLEGKSGLFKTFLGKDGYDFETSIKNLGMRWETNYISYKLYPCCQHLSAFIDCIKEIKKRETFQIDEIDEIEGIISPQQAELVCIPLESKQIPRTPYDAKFSLPYVIAVTLLRNKCVLEDFTSEAIQENKVLDLAKKVKYSTSDSTGFPKTFPGWTRIKLKNGRILEHREKENRGGPENPSKDEEIIEKFESNAKLALPIQKVKDVKEKLLNVEDLKNINSLTKDFAF